MTLPRCGEREDAGGPAVKALLERAGYTVGEIVLVPDERGCIEKELIRAADEENIALIVTTGGTGFAERDERKDTVNLCIGAQSSTARRSRCSATRRRRSATR